MTHFPTLQGLMDQGIYQNSENKIACSSLTLRLNLISELLEDFRSH